MNLWIMWRYFSVPLWRVRANPLNPKQRVIPVTIVIWCISSFLPLALSDAQGCQHEELGLWTNVIPFNLESSIKIQPNLNKWTNFAFQLEYNNALKGKILIQKKYDSINLHGLGLQITDGKIPLSFFPSGSELVFTFLKNKNQYLNIQNQNRQNLTFQVAGINLKKIDSIRVYNNKTIDHVDGESVKICNPDMKHESKQLSSTAPALCPTPTPCPQIFSQQETMNTHTESVTCPPAITITRTTQCPTPPPCPTSTLNPCTTVEPSKTDFELTCPTLSCPTVTCPLPKPCPTPMIITSTKSYPSLQSSSLPPCSTPTEITKSVIEEDDSNENGQNLTTVQKVPSSFVSILMGPKGMWIIYGLTAAYAVLSIITIVLAIALYKARKQQSQSCLEEGGLNGFNVQLGSAAEWGNTFSSQTYTSDFNKAEVTVSQSPPNYCDSFHPQRTNRTDAGATAISPIYNYPYQESSDEWDDD